ncbi:hypothetical protein [Bacillus cereus]|uniref:hypothetical protein n=1 Tax=Bacillus cereus TaxID=1396 RepID=UPI0015CF0822|nr:hypothetical protein [Bacillus cereus]
MKVDISGKINYQSNQIEGVHLHLGAFNVDTLISEFIKLNRDKEIRLILESKE